MSSDLVGACRVSDDVRLGENVKLYGFSNIYGCEIGDETRIGTFCEIQRGARIGAHCKIQSHSFICEGVTLEECVFIGHGVMFTNDLLPRAATEDGQMIGPGEWKCVPTLVKRGASIGSNATILPGLTIGEHAIVGAGSVVTKDVPARTIVYGIPARVSRQLPTEGEDAVDTREGVGGDAGAREPST